MPGTGWIFFQDCNHDDRMPAGFPGFPKEFHSRLFRRFTTFLFIATQTTGYNVLPACFSAHGPWNYVIVGKLIAIKTLTTVLARVTISRVYILATKPYSILIKADELDQPDNSRQAKRDSGSANFPVICLQNLYFSQDHQNNGSLPGNYSERLIGSI